MALKILVTGGTLDKRYQETRGELIFTQTHIPKILKQARVTMPYTLETLMLIDSLDMTDGDRERILKACKNAKEKNILITHGTDTMRETAEVLGKAKLNKTIVLTGAMRPYEMSETDAVFNVGFAFACAQTSPTGVYIAMNGRVFDWDKVRKNKEVGRFEKI